MAQSPSTNPAPLSSDTFLADRMQFWSGFCNFVIITSVFLVALLAAMAFFLV